MKQYKMDVINAMEEAAKDLHAVQVKRAAEKAGVDRLSRQEVEEIVRAFCKKHPTYKPYILRDTENSLFTYFENAWVADNWDDEEKEDDNWVCDGEEVNF